MYFIQKNLTRLANEQNSFFMDPKQLKEVTSKLKKGTYSIYYPYPDSEKNIVYEKELPEVLLYEIIIKTPVRHQDILGSLYSLNIAPELFGDILIIENRYYVYILKILQNYFESNFLKVKNSSIELKEIPVDTFKDYYRSYKEIEIIASSNRIDTIVSILSHTNRSNITHMIQKKEIMLNYDYLKNADYKLKEGDTFSIKRIGKFKYHGIKKSTKSNKFILIINQYL